MPIDPSKVQWDSEPTEAPTVHLDVGLQLDRPALDESKIQWDEPAAPSLRDTVADVAGRTWEGVKGGAARLRDELLPPGNPLTMFSGHDTEGQGTRRKAELAQYEADLKSGKLGTAGAVGDFVPEMALTAVPIAKTGNAVAKAGRYLPRAFAKFAPAVADIGVNAGYEAGKAGYKGEDPVSAALMGGVGAAGGRLIGNVGGRVWNGVSDEARTLLRNGITPTYGQAFGNDGIVAAAERITQGLPFAGAAVDRAKGRALRQYSEAEIDAALKGTGIPHDGSGFKAVRQVNGVINDAYEQIKPQTYLTPQDVKRAGGQTQQALRDIPLLTDDQSQQVGKYYMQKVVPEIQRAQSAGGVIDGVTAKKIDAEIGDLARSYANSPNPSDHPLGEAFYTLQTSLRDALRSNDPAVLHQLQVLNGAYKRMVPINIATERATATRGAFTPDQFRGAMTRTKVPGYSDRLALNDAARETLNAPGSGLTNALTRYVGAPGLGGAGLYVAHAAGVPPEAIAAGGAAIAAGGATVAHALYSEQGIRMMLGAMDLIPTVRQWVMKLPPERQQEFVLRMMAENPVSMRQLAAQVGRQVATQGGQP